MAGQRRSTLVVDAIVTCRKRRRAPKIFDTTGATLTGGDVLVRALVLRRLLRRRSLSPDETHVGVLLPPSAAAVVTNVALTFDGRTVVNLNYSLSSNLINTCIRAAGITHVITSRRFLERVPLTLDTTIIYLEDFKDAATLVDKLAGAVLAHAVPARLLAKLLGHASDNADDPLAVMFTSGSTGEPKGAVLSHGNVGSNAAAVDQVIHLRQDDVLVGILPFFHSFGFTVTLWTPLTVDIAAAYHVIPLDARVIGALARERKGTILLATPMFLRPLICRCAPDDFDSLEVVVTGGEHLPHSVADEFEAKFGVRPVEGYGCTETSPMIASNVPPSRAIGDPALAWREGTVGQAIPGVQVKTVDLETGIDLPRGQQGMLLASGKNVMRGYLNQPEATAKVIRDGWYVTGDVAIIEADGFIRIVGRESRFAKIGGEMVSHLAIEEPLTEIVGAAEDGMQKLVVVSVPDPARGERLAVVHSELEQTPQELRRSLASAGLPNLYIPAASDFVQVDSLPLIGTGKLNLREIKRIAESRTLTPVR